MMEIVQYLCEFFFGNFWHYIGLVILVGIIFRMPLIHFDNSITNGKEKNNDRL